MPQNPAHNPIDNWLSLTSNEGTTRRVYEMTPDDKHIGNPAIRAIHGGVVTLFLERVAELEISKEESAPFSCVIVNTNVDFLRSAKLKPMFGAAVIVRRGRRLAVVNAKAGQDDPERLVGQATISLKID